MSANSVKLYIYELSNGLARQMSPLLLGKQIEGIWHTGVVCYGREFYFGGGGIEFCLPGGTILGEPDNIIDLGETQIPEEVFTDFIKGLGAEAFRADKYHLFDHNCNKFSNELTMFLTGKKIPKQIRNLPHEIANSAFGQMIKPIIESMTVTPGGGSSVNSSNTQTSNQEATSSTRSSSSSSSSANPESIFEPRESNHFASNDKSRIPSPMLFQASDVQQDIKVVKEAFYGSQNERRYVVALNDMQKLVMKGKSVKITDDYMNCIERIFQELSGKSSSKINVLELLKALTLEKSFVNHSKVSGVLSCVINNLLECISTQEQNLSVASIHVLCNFISTKPGHNSLVNSKNQLNLTSVITTCLLQEDHESVCKAASELAFNVARYKVPDDIAFEYATAALEVTNRKLDKSTIYNLLFAFCQFMKCSSEVSGLAQALGIDVNQYIGQSEDIDELCHEIKVLLKQ